MKLSCVGCQRTSNTFCVVADVTRHLSPVIPSHKQSSPESRRSSGMSLSSPVRLLGEYPTRRRCLTLGARPHCIVAGKYAHFSVDSSLPLSSVTREHEYVWKRLFAMSAESMLYMRTAFAATSAAVATMPDSCLEAATKLTFPSCFHSPRRLIDAPEGSAFHIFTVWSKEQV